MIRLIDSCQPNSIDCAGTIIRLKVHGIDGAARKITHKRHLRITDRLGVRTSCIPNETIGTTVRLIDETGVRRKVDEITHRQEELTLTTIGKGDTKIVVRRIIVCTDILLQVNIR